MSEWVLRCPEPETWAKRVRAHSTPGEGGCLLWTGRLDHWGYGKFGFVEGGGRRMTGAHRAAWLAICGEIPPGLAIDHLCRTHACVNVEHMELVTGRVNTLRADHSGKAGHSGKPAGAVLHSCGRHGREDGYERMYPDGYTRWTCRICRRVNVRRYRSTLRAA